MGSSPLEGGPTELVSVYATWLSFFSTPLSLDPIRLYVKLSKWLSIFYTTTLEGIQYLVALGPLGPTYSMLKLFIIGTMIAI